MNWKEFKKNNIGARLRLRPLPKIREGGNLDDWQDVDWIVSINEEKRHIVLSSVGYDYSVTLGKDHIYSFMTDPQRSKNGMHYGILKLHVLLIIDGFNISLEPVDLFKG